MQEQSSDYSNMKCSRQESSTKISNGASCSTNNTIKPAINAIKKKIGKSYQDTKNIPKNFGKAIMKYIKEQQEVAQKLLGPNQSFQQFYQRILSKKDKIISIKEFKTLFNDQVSQKEKNNFPHLSEETILLFNKVYRSLAYKFLRSEFQSYLLGNRKIKHIDVMNKYKIVLLQGIVSPNEFNSWKISD
ncbi:hypothetical protein PPERSA_06469 [Pseudocohnilembus persalinus]|uniref:Uncharacterized protein n=1 Tax=Pseudocohnilembus persalinus TaxID=266149 RepID=A0A0V0QRD0_PSEPJ|nr:hypothetical protein PPERSA_06469 [Pseudocohnilembus persalinus]|eukprot:KRX04835.1 hypothetical protein PPERSA_06469 [Pseudocohnilembus persalinus]